MSYTIINDNNITHLKTIQDNTIDSIITDPPYGIEFLGKDWDTNTGAVETWQECLRVLKPGGYLLAFSAARTYHNLATNIESVGFEIRDQLMWLYSSGFPKAQDIGKSIQRRQGVEKTTINEWASKNTMNNVLSEAQGKERLVDKPGDKGIETPVPTSPEAKQWAGWKTALKPSHEPIVMARKPFKGSTIDNVLTHGVGALNIDASRIESEPFEYCADGIKRTTYSQSEPAKWNDSDKQMVVNDKGRFPSNVIGEVAEHYQKYFYCPKVSRRERHCGFEQMPDAMFGQHQGAYDDNGQRYAVELDKRTGVVGNNHPTVKPVELMKYLIKLVTPTNSHVLDPFCGSGSTGMAAVELGHTFTGIELDADYVEIAKRRIKGWNRPQETNNTYNELFEENK
jgi:site-specific DNA-methyltransferase (adenine-specific)